MHDPGAEQSSGTGKQQHLEHAALNELQLKGVEHGRNLIDTHSHYKPRSPPRVGRHATAAAPGATQGRSSCRRDAAACDWGQAPTSDGPMRASQLTDAVCFLGAVGPRPVRGKGRAHPRRSWCAARNPSFRPGCGPRARRRGGPMTTPLPAAPSLEHLRKQAKDLVRAREGGRRAAAACTRRSSRSPASTASRAGHASRPTSTSSRPAGPGPRTRSSTTSGYYEDRADGLAQRRRERPRERHRRRPRATIRGSPTRAEAELRAISQADARLVLAREHGFASWEAFRRHIEGLAQSGEPFRLAFKAIEAGDRTGLRDLLDGYPWLVVARGTNGNDLLGLAAGGTRDRA